MASYLRLAAEALTSPGTRGSWAQRFAEGCENAGTFNGATVAALSGTGPWLKQLYEALSPKPTFEGANWIQRLCGGGGAEFIAAAANSGGGSPTALAVADFKNGVYSIGGVSKTRAQTVEQNTDYGSFDPATIVNGTGLTVSATGDGGEQDAGSYPCLTPAAFTALQAGFVCVVTTAITNGDPDAGTCRIQVQLQDVVGGNSNYFFEIINSASPLIHVGDWDVAEAIVAGNSSGTKKTAFRFAPAALSLSFAGGSAGSTGTPQDNTAASVVGISVSVAAITNAATCTMTVEKIEFFALADYAASDLPALSA